MTEGRYLAYKRVRSWIDAFPVSSIGWDERAALEDCAEGLLLTRDDDRLGHETLLDRSSLVLAMLFGEQRITAAQSELVWNGLVACGPDHAPRGAERRPTFSAA